MMVEDYAENRKAAYAGGEVKSAYFGRAQYVLHPIVVYHKVGLQVVRHSLMYISDDIRKTYHHVHHFTVDAINRMKAEGDVKRCVIFSDGCGAQYKGKLYMFIFFRAMCFLNI